MAPHHGIWGTIQTMECKWISEIPRNSIQTSLSIIICEHMTYITDSQHIYRSFNFQWYQSLVAGALGQFRPSSKFLKSWHLTLGTAMRCPAGLWFQHFAVHFAICKSVQPWATWTWRKSWKCKMQRYWKSQVSQVSAPIRLEYQTNLFWGINVCERTVLTKSFLASHSACSSSNRSNRSILATTLRV